MLYGYRFKSIFVKATLVSMFIFGLGISGVTNAGKTSNNQCPVGLVKGLTPDEEFGPGSQELTKCLNRRSNVKVVMQVNKYCRDSVANADCKPGRPYALRNMINMINDYETTHGMEVGKDYEIAAVVHSGGGFQMIDGKYYDPATKTVVDNQFAITVKELIAKGVKFYFCQNTTRSLLGKGVYMGANPTDTLIEGVSYVTAGVTAIADFQAAGYRYVQP